MSVLFTAMPSPFRVSALAAVFLSFFSVSCRSLTPFLSCAHALSHTRSHSLAPTICPGFSLSLFHYTSELSGCSDTENAKAASRQGGSRDRRLHHSLTYVFSLSYRTHNCACADEANWCTDQSLCSQDGTGMCCKRERERERERERDGV